MALVGVRRALLSGSVYTPQAAAIFAAMTTPPTTARKRLINSCIVALLAANIWTKLDTLYVFAAADAQAALINWVNPGTFNCATGGTPTFTANAGYTGNGATGLLSTGYNLSSSGGKYARDDASMFGWCNTNSSQNTPLMAVAAVSNAHIFPILSNQIFLRVNQGGDNIFTNTDGRGFYSETRSGANASQYYKNGASIGAGAGASTALANSIVQFLSGDNGKFSTFQVMCGGFGSQLDATAHAALYAALHTYLQAVAGIA